MGVLVRRGVVTGDIVLDLLAARYTWDSQYRLRYVYLWTFYSQ
jgi:hypothetical protein